MKSMKLIALPIILALALPVAADARPVKSPVSKSKKVKKAKRPLTEAAGPEPRVRIRHASSSQGLTPLEFARWLRENPGLTEDRVQVRPASSTTRLLNKTVQHFVEADRNRDGRVSAEELADFVQPEPMSRMTRAARSA